MDETIARILRFQCDNCYPLPLNVRALCRRLGLELVPVMDITRGSGLKAAEVYALWGNRDGVLQRCGARHVLSYNNYQPLHRQRFTMCEEIGHFLLGHLDDPAFRLFSQSYEDVVYQRCEQQARLAAGMLLCPPRWYFHRDAPPDAQALSALCNVSLACAGHIIEDYRLYGEAIRRSPLYGYTGLNGSR